MSFSTRSMTPSDWALIVHFTPTEFIDHGTGQNCAGTMGLEFIQWLDQVRASAGVPMPISSSYRDPTYNATIHGATKSAHMQIPCEAVDVVPAGDQDRYHIIHAAIIAGGVRIGIYGNGSLHLDRAESDHPSPALWTIVD